MPDEKLKIMVCPECGETEQAEAGQRRWVRAWDGSVTLSEPESETKRGRGVKQLDLEEINAKLRGAVVEELVTSDDEDDGTVILSFRGDVPDLKIRPVGDDLGAELELRFL